MSSSDNAASADELKPPSAPAGIYGPDGRPKFFDDPAMDRFVSVMLNMAAELWIQDTRIAALEAASSGQKLNPAEREGKSMDFVNRLFAPLREPR